MTASLSTVPALSLDSIGFFGRSYDEYLRLFALDAAALSRRRILDVAAGPASFAAEASRRGLDVTAVDPLYGCTPAALRAHIHLDYARMFARMRAQPGLFRFERFRSFAEAEADRTAAAQGFLTDYDAHFVHGRYVGGALPRLPFATATYDLVLCGHLLFLHQRQFDFAFHLAACRELLRVARQEVRIHPLCGPDGQRYPAMDELLDALRADGVEGEERPAGQEFFRGANTVLVLRPVSAGICGERG